MCDGQLVFYFSSWLLAIVLPFLVRGHQCSKDRQKQQIMISMDFNFLLWVSMCVMMILECHLCVCCIACHDLLSLLSHVGIACFDRMLFS